MSIFGREHKEDGIGVCLLTLTNEFEADRVIAALKSQGICAYKHEDGANQLMGIYMGAGDFHPVSIFVAEEAREKAAELLEEMGFTGDLTDSSNIRLITHAAVRMEVCGKVVYLDPYQIREASHDADLILITHEHYDHYSPEDIDKLATKGGSAGEDPLSETGPGDELGGDRDRRHFGIYDRKRFSPERKGLAGVSDR